MGTLTIRIDAKLEKSLDDLARAKHRNKSDLVRDMLRRHMTADMFDDARRELRPFAEKAGYLTDEDFFRDFS